MISTPDYTLHTAINHLITVLNINAVSNVCHKTSHDSHMGDGKLSNSIILLIDFHFTQYTQMHAQNML